MALKLSLVILIIDIYSCETNPEERIFRKQ